jgi:macrolide transport system ATP-binding/permease protein
MLSVVNLFKSYNLNTVLHDVSLSMDKNTRAGLVGANGSGKTTLLKIIAGLVQPDSGHISCSSSIVIGYLPQTITDLPYTTIEPMLLSSFGVDQLQKRLNELQEAESKESGIELDNLIKEYGEISERFDRIGRYDIDHRICEILNGLSIGYLDGSREIETLSGGEKTRLSLAAVLLKSPDLLVLDEPTNNLDSQSLEWLEKYLSKYRGGMIAASHDREFLNNTVKVIFEIDEHTHTMTRYAGNYDAYKLVKERERARQAADYMKQQEEIKELNRTIRQTASELVRHRKFTRDHEKFAVTYKGERREQGVTRNIQSAKERLLHIQNNPFPKPAEPLCFKPDVKFGTIKSAEVISVSRVSKSYGGKSILKEISFVIGHRSRILIAGSNGAGKTTLLRIIVGEEIAEEGHVKLAPAANIGYLSQEPYRGDADISIVDCWLQRYGCTANEAVFSLVTCGLFRYEDLTKSMGELSLGQLRKIEIAGLIAAGPNMLILDEPTNHLSLDVLESFEDAIRQFPGPVIAVSHDRRFARQFGGERWELKDGKLRMN